MKRYLILVFIILLIPNRVKAGCSNGESLRLQRLANNVSISYEYTEAANEFTITISNLSDELVIKDISTNEEYHSNKELTIPKVKSGLHTFYISASRKNCLDGEVSVKNIKIPFYNKFYDFDECKKIPNYKYCSKWLPNSINYKTWKKYVDNYNKKIEKKDEEIKQQNKKTVTDYIRETIIALYVNYYYIFLPVTIAALAAIIYLKNKSDQLI